MNWKSLSLRVIVGIVSIVFVSELKAERPLGNIMPFGSSIAAGYIPYGFVPGGAREKLYLELTARGYAFSFVGSSTVYSSPILDAAGQNHHEGHNGYTIQQSIDGIRNSNWLDVDPDYILMHVGGNDMLASDFDTAIERYDTLLDEVYSRLPNVHVIVSKYTGGSTVTGDSRAVKYDANVVIFNDALEDLVNQRILKGDNVSMVDMYSLLNINHQVDEQGTPLFADISHPNKSGYDLMGIAWAEAIEATVPEPATMSLITLGGLAVLCRRK